MMKTGIKQITVFILIALLMGACASSKPKGMRKKRKKNCDCPPFGMLNKATHDKTTLMAINGQGTD